MDDHHFKEEEMKPVGELSKVSSQIVLKCLYLARIGRPDILWSVNKLARSITKWTKACDKRLSRVISYIHHTCDYKAILLCGKHSTTMQIRIVPRLWFCRRRRRLEVNIRRNLVHFRKPNICAKELDVQETDLSVTQFYGSWSHLSRCRFTHGRHSRSHSLGFGEWSISFLTKPNQPNHICKKDTVKPVGKSSTKHAKTNSNHAHQPRSDQHWSRSIK